LLLLAGSRRRAFPSGRERFLEWPAQWRRRAHDINPVKVAVNVGKHVCKGNYDVFQMLASIGLFAGDVVKTPSSVKLPIHPGIS